MEQAWKQNEAKGSKKLKTLIVLRFFDDIGGELGWQRLQKESPKSHASPEESSWNKHGSKMKQKGAKSSKKVKISVLLSKSDGWRGAQGGPE